MKVLWAPWRMVYLSSVDEEDTCLFCRVAQEPPSVDNLVLVRTDHALLMMNKFPYNTGHLMVAPLRHVAAYEDLQDHELLAMDHLTQEALKLLRRVFSPHAFNLGMNLGRIAGAGIDQHLHLHIVPRWQGDTNFMPVIADTKVIPEALEATYRRLREALS